MPGGVQSPKTHRGITFDGDLKAMEKRNAKKGINKKASIAMLLLPQQRPLKSKIRDQGNVTRM